MKSFRLATIACIGLFTVTNIYAADAAPVPSPADKALLADNTTTPQNEAPTAISSAQPLAQNAPAPTITPQALAQNTAAPQTEPPITGNQMLAENSPQADIPSSDSTLADNSSDSQGETTPNNDTFAYNPNTNENFGAPDMSTQSALNNTATPPNSSDLSPDTATGDDDY